MQLLVMPLVHLHSQSSMLRSSILEEHPQPINSINQEIQLNLLNMLSQLTSYLDQIVDPVFRRGLAKYTLPRKAWTTIVHPPFNCFLVRQSYCYAPQLSTKHNCLLIQGRYSFLIILGIIGSQLGQENQLALDNIFDFDNNHPCRGDAPLHSASRGVHFLLRHQSL